MSDDNLGIPIDDLELSVRGSGLLDELAVSTVGELLDLPTIRIPDDWPPKIAGLVAAEIREVLSELGLEYTGEIVVPPLAAAELVAEGTVAERWETIRGWLADNQPAALAQFRPPATDEQIAAAEQAIGRELPADYKAFLAIHDGQEDLAPFVGLGSLLSIEEVSKRATRDLGEEFDVDASFVGEGVRAVNFCKGWIPITCSARGRDFFCLDLDPGEGGTHGQIVEYIIDDSARPLIAKGFAELLSMYCEQAQTGEIDFDL